MLKNTKRYLAECGDLEATIAEIESRLDDIEQAIDAEHSDDIVVDIETDDDEVCPECGSAPCTCEEDEECEDGECEDSECEDSECEDSECEDGECEDDSYIDDEDVDEIEELDFSNPNRAFLVDDTDEDEPDADGGLYPYEDDDEEDGPYYR